jgi:cytochrome c553
MKGLPCLLLAFWGAMVPTANAADPERGRLLFNTAPRPGLLACADCHGERPQEQNFGNIWAGRHAAFLIDRAIALNTGGMGYFRNFLDNAAVADIAAWLGTTPHTIAFPDTAAGTHSVASGLGLSSSSKAAITGLSWRVEGEYTVSPGTCAVTLERFSACTLEVAFAPREPGPRPGALLISHDGSPSPIRIPLSGSGLSRPAAVASFGPAVMNFGTGSPPRAATLRNDSAVALVVREVKVNGPGLRWAGGSCLSGLTLPAAASCSVLLDFAPAQAGVSVGFASVVHDGQGGISTIELRGSATTILPRLSPSTASIDLGTIGIGEVATSSWVALVNQGPGSVTWTPPATGDPAFSVAASDCGAGAAMAAGATCRVRVAFRPMRPGRFTSTLRWAGPAAAVTPEIAVAGLAIAGTPLPAAAPNHLAQSPDTSSWAVDQVALAMGGGTAGTRVTRRLTLRNPGDAALELGRIALTGDAAGEFSLGGDCQVGRSIPGRQACQIEVSRTTRGATDSTLASLLVQAGTTGQQATILLDTAKAEEVPSPPNWIPAGGLSAATALELRIDGLVLGTPMDWGGLQVGAAATPRTVTLVNRSTLPSPPLIWRLDGRGGADWSISAPASAGACAAGQLLAPGAQCVLLIGFHAAGPGQRQGWLFVPRPDGLPALQLRGMGFVPAAGRVVAGPPAVTFQATPTAAPPSQVVVLTNEGAAVARVAGLGVTGAGFEVVPSPVSACPTPPFDLLPGLSCNLGVAWAGTPAGAAEAELLVATGGGAGDLRVPLAVAEDVSLRTNEGGSGGALHGLWWLSLALAAGVLRGSPPGHGTRRRSRRAR